MTKVFAAVAALLLSSVPATAQEKITVSRTSDGYLMRVEDRLGASTRLLPSVPRMMEDFVAGAIRPGSSSNFLTSVSASRDLFPVATVDSVADGLERLAFTHPDEQVTRAAVYSLGFLGDGKGSLRRGNVARLIRIYRAADYRRRSAVVDVLGRAGERGAAAAFLRSVAVGDTIGPDRRLPEQAVFSLSLLGPEGVATLRELHERGLVKESGARMLLGGLSRQGFDSRRKP
ncbi:MAG TPA: hypothetical protein VE913_08880 [Longimicrobium sp.]|nr:hypothetical protein [Longimicrobium sp.]